MRRVLAVSIALTCACGSEEGGSPTDAGGDDPDGNTQTTDAGTFGPRAVMLTLTNRPNNAATYSFFVAYQDGSAPWQNAPTPTGDTYTLPIHAPSYGIAFGCIGTVPGNTPTQLRTITTAHFAVGERTELTFDVPSRCSDRGVANITLSGVVTNRPNFGVVVVQFGNRIAFVGSQSGNYQLQTPPGTRDLIVAHAVPLGNGEYYVDEAVITRDVSLTASATRSIDFSAAQPTRSYPVDIDPPNFNSRAVATTTLHTANGTALGLVRVSSGWESIALAASQAVSTDVYDQVITVTTAGQSATVSNATSTPGPQTWSTPMALGAVQASVPTKQPYPFVLSSWPAYANTIGYTWNVMQQLSTNQCGGNTACTIVWSSFLSPGVIGTMPLYLMPDLSNVSGWKSAFALVENAQAQGSVTAQTSSAGAGDFPPETPANGTKRTFVRRDFAVTP